MNSQIYDEAAQWLVENQMDNLDAGMRERFCAWLDSSPEHVRVYLELSALWEDASGVDTDCKLDVNALMEVAKSENNLFPLGLIAARDLEKGVSARDSRSQPRGWQRRARWMGLAASIAVVSIGLAAVGYWNSFLRGVYSTAVGEQRMLVLADGTTVELNAATRIRERFTDAQRTVDLLEGQALFRVAKNPARPFVVSSDMATVRAVGTQFDVHRRATGTTVTVLEGRVALIPVVAGRVAQSVTVNEDSWERQTERASRRASPNERTHLRALTAEVFLEAGEQMNVYEGGRRVVLERADMGLVTAWTQQRLEFEASALRDVAEDFNRFNARKLLVNPSGLEDFKVSGTFEALDPRSLQRFVQFLREQPGLSVVESDDKIVVAKIR